MGYATCGPKRIPKQKAIRLMITGGVMCALSIYFGLAQRSMFEDAWIHILISCLIAFFGLCLLGGGVLWYMKVKDQNPPQPTPLHPSQLPQLGAQPGPMGYSSNPPPCPMGYSSDPPPYPATQSNFAYTNSGYSNPAAYPAPAYPMSQNPQYPPPQYVNNS